MANVSQQLDILERLLALMRADSVLSERFNSFLDCIPEDIPGNSGFPVLAIDWSGDTHKPVALGGYRKVCSLYTILIAVNDWDRVDARKNLIELAGLVTDFLSTKTIVAGQQDNWDRGILAEGTGQNVRVGTSTSSDRDTGFVYSAAVMWEADYRKAKVD